MDAPGQDADAYDVHDQLVHDVSRPLNGAATPRALQEVHHGGHDRDVAREARAQLDHPGDTERPRDVGDDGLGSEVRRHAHYKASNDLGAGK